MTWSDFVTVRGNTAAFNNVDNLNSGTWRGELSNAQSSNNTWEDNIAVTGQSVNANNTAIGNYSYGGYVNANVVWRNNVTFNGTPGDPSLRLDGGNNAPLAADGNLLGVDPRFVDVASFHFGLRDTSPAFGLGFDAEAPMFAWPGESSVADPGDDTGPDPDMSQPDPVPDAGPDVGSAPQLAPAPPQGPGAIPGTQPGAIGDTVSGPPGEVSTGSPTEAQPRADDPDSDDGGGSMGDLIGLAAMAPLLLLFLLF